MKRSRLKRRGRSRFPKVRDPAYTAMVREQGCVLRGRSSRVRMSLSDVEYVDEYETVRYWHVCWGRIEFMHVHQTRARGAGDVGEGVGGCQAVHAWFDGQGSRVKRERFLEATGLDLSAIAAAYAVGYTPPQHDPDCPHPDCVEPF